jgi:DNA topoisomerase-1
LDLRFAVRPPAGGWPRRQGRKQYRYHPAYRSQRDQTKYGRMLAFGAALPKIRERIDGDLKLPGLPKNKVLATVVQLLNQTCMRIGNDEYAKQKRFVRPHDAKGQTRQDRWWHDALQISRQERAVTGHQTRRPTLGEDRKTMPRHSGWELFQYVDDSGEKCRVTSTDVNNYIKEITGEDFTAKDFRTWGGTGWAALVFEELGPAENATEAKKRMVEAIKSVSAKLGNRPATCKSITSTPPSSTLIATAHCLRRWARVAGTVAKRRV